MLNLKQGKRYQFVLSDGRTLVLRYEGLGQWMAAVWVDPNTNERIDPLPPYVSCHELSDGT